jgi:alpha-D-xyloside xylohydrolase
MRPLVMDFPSDQRAINVGDQFMFGPAIMVNPVTEPGAMKRHLYLPQAKWYDFWTGAAQDGGVAIDSAAPLDKLPLYVRAGSILPMGPEVQYATEKPADPIEIRIYPGADGDFTIYEDENDNYDYEKGEYAVIPLHWNDSTRTLTIGERTGSFPGMTTTRSFQIVIVSEAHGTGEAPTSSPDNAVQYSGQQVNVTLR